MLWIFMQFNDVSFVSYAFINMCQLNINNKNYIISGIKRVSVIRYELFDFFVEHKKWKLLNPMSEFQMLLMLNGFLLNLWVCNNLVTEIDRKRKPSFHRFLLDFQWFIDGTHINFWIHGRQFKSKIHVFLCFFLFKYV